MFLKTVDRCLVSATSFLWRNWSG